MFGTNLRRSPLCSVPGMIAPPRPAPRGNSLPRPAPPRKKLVLPRPAKIDKIRGASRGKVDCAVDSDIRI